MTLPRDLYLQKINNHFQLITKPAKEVTALRNEGPINLLANKTVTVGTAEIETSFDLTDESREDIGLELSNDVGEKLRIGYSAADKQFYIDRTKLKNTEFSKDFAGIHTALRISTGKQVKLHVYIDRSSVEVFADDGTVVLTDLFYPAKDFSAVQLFRQSEQTKILQANMYSLKSIW